jgi:hypothetical protein
MGHQIFDIINTRVSSFKNVSGDAVHQPTWPLLLKIEHMVKLQVLGNNFKSTDISLDRQASSASVI